jgi:hypothetical protein
LPSSWRTLYELTQVAIETLEARIADGTIHPGLQRKEAVARGPGRARGAHSPDRVSLIHRNRQGECAVPRSF